MRSVGIEAKVVQAFEHGVERDAGLHTSQVEQFPRIREIFRSDMFWSDDFLALWMEFVLYARRNPEAKRKLAASIQR
ncbi:MAG TPA: hypothetical protein VKH36_02530, partial [Acidimicrobiia bacterium]|nr:hypothetical protein [Acidimicrobiia bacterium]